MNAQAEAIRAQGEVDHIAERAIANVVETLAVKAAGNYLDSRSIVSIEQRQACLNGAAEDAAAAIKAGFAAYHGREATP